MRAMGLNPWDLDEYADPVAKRYRTAEDLVFDYILTQLESAKEIDPKDFDQWHQQHNSAQVEEYAAKVIGKVTRYSAKMLHEVLRTQPVQAVAPVETWLKNLLATGKLKNPGSLDESRKVKDIVRSYQESSPKYLAMAGRNMTASAKSIFDNVIRTASTSVNNGKSITPALYEAIQQWTTKTGLTALVDRSGRHWTPETYTRLVVTTSINSATDDVELSRIEEYGCLVKISSHAGCRPSHLDFQGRIYDPSGQNPNYPPLSDTGYGSVAGIGGINCRHYLIPHIPGQDDPMLPEAKDADINSAEYEVLEGQRRIESSIRAAKKQLDIAERFGQPVDVNRAMKSISYRQAQMRAYVKTHHVTRQYPREQIKSSADPRNIDKFKAVLKADASQFEDFHSVLKDRGPQTMEEFRITKYNIPERWKRLNRQKRTFGEINQRRDSKTWSPEFVEKVEKAYDDFFEGGVEMSTHSLSRFVDRQRKTGLTVKEALTHLQKPNNYVQEDKDHPENNRNVWYFGQQAFIQNHEQTEIVTFLVRRHPKDTWKKV